MVPPGILWFLRSQGCTPPSGFALIQAFAAGISSSLLPTTSSTKPALSASAGLTRVPSSK